MPPDARTLAAGALVAASVAGIGYTAFAIAQVRKFARNVSNAKRSEDRAISILKPLHGAEPRLYENLRTFCEQRYPAFQLIFGAADPGDAALDVARQIQRDFPALDITIAAGEARASKNPKVGNLLGLAPHVKHEIIVIADSDIAVPPDYLARIAACFDDPQTGAATCLFTGKPIAPGPAATLGAMAINDHFIPSVLVAAALEPLSWCVGATLAIRRHVLAEIGGLEAAAEHLADDYVIGRRTFEAGYRVALVPALVTTDVTERSVRDLWTHEVRWARTVFRARPAGYAGSIVTNPFPLALLGALLAPQAAWTWLAVALSLGARLAAHAESRRCLRPAAPNAPALVPVRDVLSVGVWSAAFSGRRLNWRGATYRVDADGRMLRS